MDLFCTLYAKHLTPFKGSSISFSSHSYYIWSFYIEYGCQGKAYKGRWTCIHSYANTAVEASKYAGLRFSIGNYSCYTECYHRP